MLVLLAPLARVASCVFFLNRNERLCFIRTLYVQVWEGRFHREIFGVKHVVMTGEFLL
eukprot:jgi/Botrbrau1/4923/Bobra.0122s0005.1